MCGIFGFAGKDVKDFNKDKFNILGIMNETRGKHSCGYSVDGTILKGVETFKVYRDFAAFMDMSLPVTIPTVLGHTRHATGGAHNVHNAHPFGFKINKGDRHNSFIGIHNGSLYNQDAIAKKFDISITDSFPTKTKGVSGYETRTKIDSEILLESIFKTGTYDALEMYNGAAALVWYRPEEPNVSYFYHGKSRLTSRDTAAVEERPLFYAEVDGGTYVSSILESLLVIGAAIEDVTMFDHNKVYKVTNGDVKNAEITNIDRSKCFKSKIPVVKKRSNTSNSKVVKNSQYNLKLNSPSEDMLNIYHEEPTNNINLYKGALYFNKLRYWRNGHIVTGIYSYIKGFGHYYMGQSIKSAKLCYDNNVNKYFDLGEGEFVTESIDHDSAIIPFNTKLDAKLDTYPFEYIYDGIGLKLAMDYVQLVAMSKNTIHSTMALSEAAKHPIMNINAYNGSKNQGILHNGVLFTGRFTVLGADKLYKIVDGNLKRITFTNKHFSAISKAKKISNVQAISTELSKIVTDEIIKDGNGKLNTNADPDKELLNSVSKMVLTFYSNLPTMIENVKSFKKSEVRDIVLESMRNISYELDTISYLHAPTNNVTW